jgi:cysteine desulfurase
MKIPFTMASVGADMITLSSHKIEGPKGVGALVIDAKIMKNRGLAPIIYGGGQGAGLRSGTENVPGIAAFGVAVTEGQRDIRKNYAKLSELREYLISKLSENLSLSEISPTLPESHAPHILNITLPAIKSETMLHFLSALGIFVSSGSACSSNSAHKVSALTAYGRSESEADCSIRISFSHRNEKNDVDELCAALESGLMRLARIKK